MDKWYSLRIVRYGSGIGLRNHDMAFAYTADNKLRLMFKDRSVKASFDDLEKISSPVSALTLKQSKTYKEVFKRDIDALEDTIGSTHGMSIPVCVCSIFPCLVKLTLIFTCVTQVEVIHSFFSDARDEVAQLWSFPSARDPLPKRQPRRSSENMQSTTTKIDAFINQYKRTHGAKKAIVRYIQEFNITDNDCITGTIKPNSFYQEKNVVMLDMSNEKVFDEVDKLCKHQRLSPPSQYEIVNSVHYAMFDEEKNKMETYISISSYMIKSPFKTISSIDKIASIDKKHNSSYLVEAFKKMIMKKKGTHWICTQAANTNKAQTFWKGRLTTSNYAHVLIGLINIYDSDAKIYEDSSAMCV
jgi:hypothetical protein